MKDEFEGQKGGKRAEQKGREEECKNRKGGKEAENESQVIKKGR